MPSFISTTIHNNFLILYCLSAFRCLHYLVYVVFYCLLKLESKFYLWVICLFKFCLSVFFPLICSRSPSIVYFCFFIFCTFPVAVLWCHSTCSCIPHFSCKPIVRSRGLTRLVNQVSLGTVGMVFFCQLFHKWYVLIASYHDIQFWLSYYYYIKIHHQKHTLVQLATVNHISWASFKAITNRWHSFFTHLLDVQSCSIIALCMPSTAYSLLGRVLW